MTADPGGPLPAGGGIGPATPESTRPNRPPGWAIASGHALPGRRRMTLPRTRRVRPHKGADARGRPSTTAHAFSPDWFRTPYPPPPLGEHSLVALAAFIATAARGGEAGHSGVDGGEGVVEGER